MPSLKMPSELVLLLMAGLLLGCPHFVNISLGCSFEHGISFEQFIRASFMKTLFVSKKINALAYFFSEARKENSRTSFDKAFGGL